MAARTSYAHGQFSWVDLSSHGMDDAKTFYASLFGWTYFDEDTQGGPPYATISLEGQSVAGLGELNDEMKGQGIPPTWNSYVTVDDIDRTIEQATSMGGTVTVPVMDVMDVGRLAFFLDPTGGHLALWQPKSHIGAERVNQPGSFCWNELVTRDADAAAEFFGQLFGWTYKPNPDAPSTYHIIQCAGGMNGGIMQMTEEWGETPPHWTVYFAVDDINARSERVKAGGGKVCHGPFETPVGPISVCSDPQGAMFNLIQLKDDVV